MSGDVTISSAGVTAIGTGKVTSGMILDGTIADADLAANTLSAALPNWGTFYNVPQLGATSTATGFTNSYAVGQVQVLSKCTLTGIGYWVGGTQSGNVRVGLYNSAGTSVASKTSDVAQAAINTFQQVAFDSTYAAAAGRYFAVVIFSSATATAQFGRGLVPSNFVAATGSTTLPGSVSVPTIPIAGVATIAATTY